MKNADALRSTLNRIDGRGYKAYRDLEGEYDFGSFRLLIDRVQGDPYAAPSRLIVTVDQNRAVFPDNTFHNRSRRIALCDYLTRRFHDAARRIAKGRRGSGKGGRIEIDAPGQEILERSSIDIDPERITARFFLGLPAFGRRIAGQHAEAMLCTELPEIVREALFFDSLDAGHLYRHIETAEDADALRVALPERGLIAFIADHAVLPRVSGIDARPLQGDRVVPFRSPP